MIHDDSVLMIKTKPMYFSIVVFFLVFSTFVCGSGKLHAMSKLDNSRLRTIHGKEGLELKFNIQVDGNDVTFEDRQGTPSSPGADVLFEGIGGSIDLFRDKPSGDPSNLEMNIENTDYMEISMDNDILGIGLIFGENSFDEVRVEASGNSEVLFDQIRFFNPQLSTTDPAQVQVQGDLNIFAL